MAAHAISNQEYSSRAEAQQACRELIDQIDNGKLDHLVN